jgi:hypothetical protein
MRLNDSGGIVLAVATVSWFGGVSIAAVEAVFDVSTAEHAARRVLRKQADVRRFNPSAQSARRSRLLRLAIGIKIRLSKRVLLQRSLLRLQAPLLQTIQLIQLPADYCSEERDWSRARGLSLLGALFVHFLAAW